MSHTWVKSDFPSREHGERFAGTARHFHSIFWQLISVLFKVQCDSKAICAVSAKSCSPGVVAWKLLHARCTTGYCRVPGTLDVQQGHAALYSAMQNVSMRESSQRRAFYQRV